MSVLLLIILYYYLIISKIVGIFLKPNPKKQTVLFLENFPVENAGYQQRSYEWLDLLRKEGLQVQILTIFESKVKYDYVRDKKSQHFFLIVALVKRFRHCLKARKYSCVVVRRELLFQNDYGNLFLEKLILKLNKNVILDFDDDLSASKGQPKKISNIYARLMLENGDKFNESLKYYKKFIVGSEYLKGLILKENRNKLIEVIPTCVNPNKYLKKAYEKNLPKKRKINIGWIGGVQNLKYLDIIVEPLNKLSKEFSLRLIIISGRKYTHPNAGFEILNLPWTMENQYSSILNFDIGIMPLFENNISKGKCSFKLIQYMASGIISVGSDIGTNNELIQNGINGFLTDNKSWYYALKTTINSWQHFSTISQKAIFRINDKYSFESNFHKLLEIIK